MTTTHERPLGRVVGVDYGTVRIGIAITDPSRSLASPLEQHARGDAVGDARYFKRLVAREDVRLFVVGLPVLLSGDESQKSFEAREFAKWLGETTGIPVELFDERFTTSLADEALATGDLTKKQRKARRDMLAAQFLLSAWLDADRGRAVQNESIE
jgi:putative Holliday junction resolvase